MKKFNIEGKPGQLRIVFAAIYDTFLVAGILMLSMALMVALRLMVSPDITEGEVAISGLWKIPAILFCLFNVALFFVYFWVKNAQTLGMQAWRIALLQADKAPLSWKQASYRFLLSILSLGLAGIGSFYRYIDPRGRSLQDKLASTELFLLKKTQ